jgi:hypothetical protein
MDKKVEQLQTNTKWQDRLPVFSVKDRKTIEEVRIKLGSSGGGLWLYVGAGNDLRPLALSSSGATHWWISPDYDPNSWIYQEDLVGRVFTTLEKSTGIRPIVTPDFKNIYASTLQVDGETEVKFIGGLMEELENYPTECDVIFLSTVTPIDPYEAAVLKKGGFVVSDGDQIGYLELELKVFEKIGEYEIDEIKPGRRGKLNIYQKIRDLSPVEIQRVNLASLVETMLKNPEGSSCYWEHKRIDSYKEFPLMVIDSLKRRVEKLGNLEPDTKIWLRENIKMKYDLDALHKSDYPGASVIVDFYNSLA